MTHRLNCFFTILILLSLLSQSLLVFFLCISRAQTMHLGYRASVTQVNHSVHTLRTFLIIIIVIIIMIIMIITFLWLEWVSCDNEMIIIVLLYMYVFFFSLVTFHGKTCTNGFPLNGETDGFQMGSKWPTHLFEWVHWMTEWVMKYSQTANTNGWTTYSPVRMGWHKWVNRFLINFEWLMKNDGVMLSFWRNGQIWSDKLG